MSTARLAPVSILTLVLVVAGCSGPSASTNRRTEVVVVAPGANDRANLNGSGSTFVTPIVNEWTSRYRQVAGGVTIAYEPSGSVSGIEQLESGVVDFAASEMAPTDEERDPAESRDVVRVPWTAGGVAVVYNLTGLPALKLSPGTLAAIFTGEVARWDNPSVVADNVGVDLPSREIRVVRRADASGTTKVFTEFLEASAPGVWPLGSGPTVRWPRGSPARGSDGVARAVEQTPGAIGYVGTGQPLSPAVGTALVRNGAGAFIGPTPDSVGAALSGANPGSPGAYPITTLSYVIFAASGADPTKEAALRHFAAWVLTEGQRSVQRLGYARLPLHVLTDALRDVYRLDPTSTSTPSGRP